MRNEDFKRWSEIRKKGLGKYILLYGILYWGMPVGIIIVFSRSLREEGIQILNDWMGIVSHTMIGIIYGILIGTLYGFINWRSIEKNWLNESEIRKNLLDYLNHNKYTNAYIIRAIFNNIVDFNCEIQSDENNQIKGIVSIWEEDKAVTLRGDREFCIKWFNKLCHEYDFYDLEEDLIHDLVKKARFNLDEKKISYYLIMVYDSNGATLHEEFIDYKSVDEEEWNRIAQLYYEKYNIYFTDFQPQNMKWLAVYDKEEAICNICLEKVDNKMWVLSNFYTAPHMRNKGIGTMVLKSILKDYSNNELLLFVNMDNKKAIELYKRLGFKEYEKVGNIEF